MATSGFMLPLLLPASAMGLYVRAAHTALLLRHARDEFCGVDRVGLAIIAAGIASGVTLLVVGGDIVAVFLIIWTLATFFTACIAVGMLVTILSGMLRCVGGGFLGVSDDEAQPVRREPALRIDGLTVEERQRRSRALVIEQLRQLTLRER
jgi:hypothetical protein